MQTAETQEVRNIDDVSVGLSASEQLAALPSAGVSIPASNDGLVVMNRAQRRKAMRKHASRQRFNNRPKTDGRTKFRETGFMYLPFRPHFKTAI